MSGRVDLISRNDPAALARAAEALRAWDPNWDVVAPDRDALLYEPDGMLYALCRAGGMTVHHNHRELALSVGDLLLVPRALALEIEPVVDLVALRHAGTPPDHFRERFIQVWGFEHVRPDPQALAAHGSVAAIPPADTRYPLAFTLADGQPNTPLSGATGVDCVLAVALAGEPCVLRTGTDGEGDTIPPGGAVLLGPGMDFAFSPLGRLALVTIFHELSQHARRRAATADPEFDPAGR